MKKTKGSASEEFADYKVGARVLFLGMKRSIFGTIIQTNDDNTYQVKWDDPYYCNFSKEDRSNERIVLFESYATKVGEELLKKVKL